MNHLGNAWTYHFYGSVIVDENLEIDGVLYGDHIEANSIQARTDDIPISSRNNNSSLLISDTGYVSINNEYDLPSADGTANQVLKTDGLGNTSFATLSSSYISDFELDKLTDVTIAGTPNSNQLLIYSTGQWRNTTPFLRLDGIFNMTGTLNMRGQSITKVNLVDGIDVSVLDGSVVKLTGDQTIAGAKIFIDKISTWYGKPITIGRSTKGMGATGGLELYGNYGDFTGGAHMQAITSQDNYPTFHLSIYNTIL